MSKKVVIHQPDFAPWLGFINRWKQADLLILLDDVQFLRKGWHNRDKLRNKSGEYWVSIPVIKKGKYDQLISEVEIDYSQGFPKKLLKTIKLDYAKAAFFEEGYQSLERIFENKPAKLIDLNLELLQLAADYYDIETPLQLSSEFNIKSQSTQRLVDLCKAVNATEYITGMGSKNYLDESLFNQKDIKVIWDSKLPEPYPQLHGNCINGLSFIDSFLNGFKPENL